MTWPTGAVVTTNTDADTDSPLTARANLLDTEQKLNQIIAHATAIGQALLAAADAASGRTTLAAAALESPAFTGTPTAPTAAADTSTTQIATTAFAKAEADAAQSAAASDATTKANNAQSTAIATASADATTKANNAQATAIAADLGVGQTWQNVIGSRVVGTPYTNTSGKTIEIAIIGSMNNTLAPLNLVIGGLTIQSVNNQSSGISQSMSMSGVVSPGETYSVTGQGLSSWHEKRS